jgi:ABC-type phosphate transport system substrate-binding protein
MKRSIMLLLALTALASAGRSQVVVIANRGVPVSSIDTETLVDIYMLSQTKWENDVPIRVFALKKGSSSMETFYAHLGLNVLALNKQWMRIQLTGEGRAPLVLGDDEIVERVASTPGAIGFVDQSRVTADVKVLREVDQ